MNCGCCCNDVDDGGADGRLVVDDCVVIGIGPNVELNVGFCGNWLFWSKRGYKN